MAKPTRITVTIKESTAVKETSTMSFYMASSVNTLAAIVAAAQPLVQYVQAVITGTVESVQFSKPMDITGWTLTPSDGADTDRLVSARLVMSSADPYYAQLNFPTFDLAKLGTDKDVDLADADILALTDALTAASITTAQDNEVDNIASFYRTFGGRK